MNDDESHQASCLCGAVRFRVLGSLPAPDACHCTRCRKWSGHFYAGSDVPRAALTIEAGADVVTWFRSSEKVRRGFCSVCGSSLFFDPLDHERVPWIGVSMGAFDKPTGARLAVHIFIDDKGDYYDVADGVPQHARTPGPTTPPA
jgi:hypothetical protein